MAQDLEKDNRTVGSYHAEFAENFPSLLTNAAPNSMSQQAFLIELEAKYRKFGTDTYLSARQAGWLLAMQPQDAA
jgi:hypothetical protein